MLETFFALDEALWAAEAAREVSDLPLVMLFSFDQGTRTMMGLSPTQVVEATASLGLAAVGANCGRSLADTAKIVTEFLDAGVAVPLWVKPNAGVPQVVGGKVEYPEDPDSFSSQVAQFAAQGADRVVGGVAGGVATPWSSTMLAATRHRALRPVGARPGVGFRPPRWRRACLAQRTTLGHDGWP